MKVEEEAMAEARQQVADESKHFIPSWLHRDILAGKWDHSVLVREAYYANRARGGDDEG